MQIRQFESSDIEVIIEIWYNASLQAHSFIPEEIWKSLKEELRRKYLPNSETWVAIENDKVVGFISLLENYIGALFVDPAKQGRGAGTKLIERALQTKEQLSVGVYEKNAKARKFYENKGFKYLSKELQSETGELVINMKLTLS